MNADHFSGRATTEVLILRGLPGCGKSTLAGKIKEAICGCECPVFSADHFFLDREGIYKFDPARIGEAHAECFWRYLGHLPSRITGGKAFKIIVDNTNTRAFEIAPYVLAANVAKVNCKVLTVWSDPMEAWKRNIHGVPLKVVLDMHRALLTEQLPSFWNHEVITAEENGHVLKN